MAEAIIIGIAQSLIAVGVPGTTALSIGISVGTGAFLSSVGTLALSIGLSAASSAIMRASMTDKGKIGAGVNSTEVRLNTRQEVPNKRWIYGEVMVGGPLFWEESKGTLYYQGFLWSEGPISEVIRIQNTQNTIFLPGIAFDQILLPSQNYDGPPFVGNVRISIRRGTLDQSIDPILAEAFPGLDPLTFRQRGVATLVMEASSGATFDDFEAMWGTSRRPNPIALVRGVPVYDPRDPSQRLPLNPLDPEDLEDARLTWKWSNNASLVQADYLWRSDGGRVPLDCIRWDEVARSATYDDGLINTKDGSLIKRHTIDGIVTAGQNPVGILQSMLTANRGFIVRHQGKVWPQSSFPIWKPVITITDDMIKGGIEFRRSQPKRNVLNRLRSRFIDPRQEWTTVDGPVRNMPEWQAEDGDLYEATVDTMWTADHRRAQRLAKAALEESRLGRLLSTYLDISAVGLKAGDVVRVDSRILPRISGVYRLTEVELTDNMTTIRISGSEYDASIETNWNADVDELPFELPDLEAANANG